MYFRFLTIVELALAFALSSLAVAQDANSKNELLLDATSPFEDIAEFAIAKNADAIENQLRIAESHLAKLKTAMPAEQFIKLETRVGELKSAVAVRAFVKAADHSVEAFRLLIESLDSSNLQVPREVSLLDYAGFKIHVLTAGENPDWSAIEITTNKAVKWWSALKDKVKNRKLADAMNSTINGLQEASNSKNLSMVNFAAQLDLDLVDLLEASFEE